MLERPRVYNIIIDQSIIQIALGNSMISRFYFNSYSLVMVSGNSYLVSYLKSSYIHFPNECSIINALGLNWCQKQIED